MEEYRITIQVKKRAIHDDTRYWGKTDPILGGNRPLIPPGAQDTTLHTAAVKAARMRDLKAHVVTAEGRHRAQALWNDSRTWDPGD